MIRETMFYGQQCAKEITVEMMEKLEKEIPMLLCKMEKKIPPRFFSPMQYLLIHLPYEAKVGGHGQYRWMYHIERALLYLKSVVGNKTRVEGCIIEAFTLKDVAYFSSVLLGSCTPGIAGRRLWPNKSGYDRFSLAAKWLGNHTPRTRYGPTTPG
jgi:hypothetical protein